jgi:tetratricopeptide (TPR) repeat protein
LLSEVRGTLPDDPEAQLAAAEFHLECGEVDTAVALLGAPNEARANAFSRDLRQREQFWSLQSQILERREEVQQSLDLLDRALALSPDRLDFLVRRATLLRLLSRAEEAASASRAAEDFRRSENQLREVFRRGAHHHPTREDCTLLSRLCGELGRESQSKGWQQLAGSR